MSAAERFAKQVQMAFHGEAWHGPSWKEVLEGVNAAQAASRPIPQAHSIVEIVHHVSTWNEVVRRRLEGEQPSVTNEENFPEIQKLEEPDWEAARRSLFSRANALCETIASFPEDRLREARQAPASGTWEDLILGQLQHALYHAGQAAILRKSF